MLETPESFKYDSIRKRENFEDWAISRQLLILYYFKKALRDYTPHTQTASAAGDEIVQTTTLKSLAAGESQSGM